MNAPHALPETQVIEGLETDPTSGLAIAEVQKRQQKYGLNKIAHRRGRPLERS